MHSPLAVSSSKRIPMLPDVPTFKEAGVPAFEASVWWGFVAPAKTPEHIVKRLSVETSEALRSQEVKNTLESAGGFIIDMPHAEFQAYVAREAVKWGEVLRTAGVTLE